MENFKPDPDPTLEYLIYQKRLEEKRLLSSLFFKGCIKCIEEPRVAESPNFGGSGSFFPRAAPAPGPFSRGWLRHRTKNRGCRQKKIWYTVLRLICLKVEMKLVN